MSKRRFQALPGGFRVFGNFQIFSNLGPSKSLLGPFLVLYENLPEKMHHITQNENLNFDPFDLMILDNLGAKGFGGCLEVFQT